MDCHYWRDKFTEFIENALPQDEWRALEAHLQVCEVCAADIKAFRRTVSGLRSLELVPLPSGLAKRISQAVEQSAAPLSVEAAPVARPRRFTWQMAGSVAMAAVLLLVFGLVTMHPPRGPESGLPSVLTTPRAALPPTSPPSSAAQNVPATSPLPAAGAAKPQLAAAPPVVAARPGALQPPIVRTPPLRTAPSSMTAPSTGASHASGQMKAADRAERSVTELSAPAGPAASAAGAAPPTPRAFGATATDSALAPVPGAPLAGGVDLQVVPPAHPRVGARAAVTVSVRARVSVAHALLSVHPRGELQVTGSGRLYSGPLTANQRRSFTVTVISSAAGDQHLAVDLTSEVPGVDSSLVVTLPGFSPAPVAAPTGTIHLVLRSVALREALRRIAAEGGLKVELADSVGSQLVTADFSEGASAPTALRSVARMGGCSVERQNGVYHIK